MQESKLSPAQSKLKLTLWEKEVESYSSSDFYIWLQDMGLPELIVTRLHDLIGKTIKLGKRLVSIGKVILFKIIEFVKENPCMVAGSCAGAVVAAAVYALVAQMPIFGWLLEPLARALGIGAVLTGGSVGHSLDREIKKMSQTLKEAAQSFFSLLTTVLSSLFGQSSQLELA